MLDFECEVAGFSAGEHAPEREPFRDIPVQAGWTATLHVAGDALRFAHGERRRLPSPVYLQRHHSGLPRTGSQDHAKEYPPEC